jgi:hypothetical protein
MMNIGRRPKISDNGPHSSGPSMYPATKSCPVSSRCDLEVGTYGNSQNPDFTTETEIRLHVRDHARWG